MSKQKLKAVELTDKEFKELLHTWGAKTMEVFDINETFKYSDEQKKMLKEAFKKGDKQWKKDCQ